MVFGHMKNQERNLGSTKTWFHRYTMEIEIDAKNEEQPVPLFVDETKNTISRVAILICAEMDGRR